MTSSQLLISLRKKPSADAFAIIYSQIETCKAHKINAYLYLRYVLQEIPSCDKSEETYRSLLPFNIDPEKLKVK